jgi:Zn-dependent peptidase ImmA (M78 family)
MTLRRGFKTEAEQIALEIRSELSLRAIDRLDPFFLADYLCIPVWTVRDCLRASVNPAPATILLDAESDSFSATTVFFGRRRVIVHNEGHARTRQASNLAHEIGHCLLEHPVVPIRREDGRRYWDATMEEEATWLSGALLVPRDGALSLTRRGHTIEAIADHYGVSAQLCRWRLNQTGIFRQILRRKK